MFFSGISSHGPLFSTRDSAYLWENEEHARTQAILLGAAVRQRPVIIGPSKLQEVLGIALEAENKCSICGGAGSVDSGGFTPWDEPIFIICGACNGASNKVDCGTAK